MFNTLAKQALCWQWSHSKTNSSLELAICWPDVLSALLETVDWLVDHVQILQNDSNCNTTGTVLTWTWLACSEDRFSVKQRSPTWNTVLSILQQNSSTDYCRVCDHHKWFLTQSFTDCNLSVQISQNNCLCSHDFSDAPIISIPGIFICIASKGR